MKITNFNRDTGVEPQLEFELTSEKKPRNLKKFQCVVYEKEYKAKHNLDEVDILFVGNKIDAMFEKFLEEPMAHANDHDQVSAKIEGTGIRKHKEIFVSFKKMNFDVKEFVNKMA